MRNINSLETDYAPAEQAPQEKLNKQIKLLLDNELLNKLYSAVLEIILILNKERQIVYFNPRLYDVVGYDIDPNNIYGERIGEIFGCQHAFVKNGCGTSEYCKDCGALNSILLSQQNKVSVGDVCRILQKDTVNAIEFKVCSSYFTLDGEEYTIVTILDLSNENRRKILERIFFHDIMNTAVAVKGLLEYIIKLPDTETKELKELAYDGINKLIDEINSQKLILKAENNELEVQFNKINSKKFLNNIINSFNILLKEKNIKLNLNIEEIEFNSDEVILARVIKNILKNAIEASSDNDTISIKCNLVNNTVNFEVNNPAYMPKNVQHQVFQRSFSTKGTGRGLGTYSIKLLTERYLKGKVSFTSTKEEGTTFIVNINML